MAQEFDLNSYDFAYPEDLVAIWPQKPCRVMAAMESQVNHWDVEESAFSNIIQFFEPGDLLVLNETQVQKRRVRTEKELEILFLEPVSDNKWTVLFPAKKVKINDELLLPQGLRLRLLEKGLPQKVEVIEGELNDEYFQNHGEMALPPYIQKARDKSENMPEEETWYQTQWASRMGSAAAPTASLHFTNEDIKKFEDHGVEVVKLTLHVGLGTFLPIKTENIKDHNMHSEEVSLSHKTAQKILNTSKEGRRVWAMGSTVLRAIESFANNYFSEAQNGFEGKTDIFIYPGYEFKLVTGLLTNFHQPQSTLVAMVAAFSSLEQVQKSYAWAIDRKFKLFSYGDLSLWKKKI